KAALAKPARRAKAALRPVAKPAGAERSLSDDAIRLAAELERALAGRRPHPLPAEAYQRLMAAPCPTYAARAGARPPAVPPEERGHVANTDVMIMASGLLRSANLAVFELGMWQSWTGR